MSSKKIFDINKICCPLCNKVHTITRKDFDRYYFKCFVFEKEFHIKISNLNVDHEKYWAKWMDS